MWRYHFKYRVASRIKKGIIMSINSNKEEGVRGEVTQLRRIADILDEILRLVKKDMEPRPKKEKN